MFCDQHSDKQLEMFCNECRKVISLACLTKEHKSHKCSNVDQIAEDFRQLQKKDINVVDDPLRWFQQESKKLDKDYADFIKKIDKTEVIINKSHDNFRQMVEKDAGSLLQSAWCSKRRHVWRNGNKQERN